MPWGSDAIAGDNGSPEIIRRDLRFQERLNWDKRDGNCEGPQNMWECELTQLNELEQQQEKGQPLKRGEDSGPEQDTDHTNWGKPGVMQALHPKSYVHIMISEQIQNSWSDWQHESPCGCEVD